METITFDDIFKSSFLEKSSSFSITDACIGLLSAFLIGLFIYYVYKKTFQGVIYSHSFNIALLVMTLATALVIMGISQNVLLSLGMVGALSIVRFRTPIKDPMDLIFLFWSVATGILCGAGFIPLVVLGALIIGAVIIIFQHKVTVENPYLIVLRFDKDATEQAIEQYLQQQVKRFSLKSKTMMYGNDTEVTYEVRVSKQNGALLRELSAIDGVQSAVMLSYDGNFTA